jgi:hypothetical protein
MGRDSGSVLIYFCIQSQDFLRTRVGDGLLAKIVASEKLDRTAGLLGNTVRIEVASTPKPVHSGAVERVADLGVAEGVAGVDDPHAAATDLLLIS